MTTAKPDPDNALEGAVARMIESGCSFALCGANKLPLREWGGKKNPVMVGVDETISHLRASPTNTLSLLLGTADLALVDIDGAPLGEHRRLVDSVLAKAAPPLIELSSQSGHGTHLFYRARLADMARKKSTTWKLPRFDGLPGDPHEKKDRNLMPLKGDLKIPGSLAYLPLKNVVPLCEALLDGDPEAGVWDNELFRLLCQPKGDNLPARLFRVRQAEMGAHNPTQNAEAYHEGPFKRDGVVWCAFRWVAEAATPGDTRIDSTLESAWSSKTDWLSTLPKRATPRDGGGRDHAPDELVEEVKAGQDPVLAPHGLCAKGLSWALGKMGVRLARLMDSGGCVGIRRPGSLAWKPVDTDDLQSLLGALRNRFVYEKMDRRTEEMVQVPMVFPVQAFMEHASEAASTNPVDVMGDFLRTCDKWEDPEAAYTFLQDELTTGLWAMSGMNLEIARIALPAILIAAVGRHHEPGAKMDAMTILTSKPGMGKTTFVENILPRTREFAEKTVTGFSYGGINDTDDESLRKLVGSVIVDFSEMEPQGVRLGKLKGFVDNRSDKFREKYGMRSKAHPRTCVFTGTSNRPDPLPHDPAGHRKFWLIWLDGMAPACGEQDTADFVKAWWKERRKRLWGAAECVWFGFGDRDEEETHPKLRMPRALWAKVRDHADEGSKAPDALRVMMDQLASVPACVDWLMPEELVQLTGRARIIHGDYVPSPDWLLDCARDAVESMEGWERSNLRVVWLGHDGRPRHFRRAGSEGKRTVADDQALRERRKLLGIRDPAQTNGHHPVGAETKATMGTADLGLHRGGLE